MRTYPEAIIKTTNRPTKKEIEDDNKYVKDVYEAMGKFFNNNKLIDTYESLYYKMDAD